jgi:acyl dehydratase
MTQEAINLFEKSGGATGPSQFTDLDTARSTLGTTSTVASGRMSLTFATELLRRYFGADVYNGRGMVDMRFLRPVRPGDSVTFTGKVTGLSKEADGCRVSVEVNGTNQKGDVTAAGTGACVVPSGYLPAEE